MEQEEVRSAVLSDSLHHRSICGVQDLCADGFLLTFQLKGFLASGTEEIVNFGVILATLQMSV